MIFSISVAHETNCPRYSSSDSRQDGWTVFEMIYPGPVPLISRALGMVINEVCVRAQVVHSK
jgi:hypothetical protein